MLLPSSLPAQAASAIGSINIAAQFAEVPKCNPLSGHSTGRILTGAPAKWNSDLGYRASMNSARPGTIGEAMARAGPDIRGGAVGQCGSSRSPRDRGQPRLVAGATCLIVALETRCVLIALIFLWPR